MSLFHRKPDHWETINNNPLENDSPALQDKRIKFNNFSILLDPKIQHVFLELVYTLVFKRNWDIFNYTKEAMEHTNPWLYNQTGITLMKGTKQISLKTVNSHDKTLHIRFGTDTSYFGLNTVNDALHYIDIFEKITPIIRNSGDAYLDAILSRLHNKH